MIAGAIGASIASHLLQTVTQKTGSGTSGTSGFDQALEGQQAKPGGKPKGSGGTDPMSALTQLRAELLRQQENGGKAVG